MRKVRDSSLVCGLERRGRMRRGKCVVYAGGGLLVLGWAGARPGAGRGRGAGRAAGWAGQLLTAVWY